MQKLTRLLTSKRVLGIIATVAGFLASQPVLDKATLLKGLGVILAGVGYVDADQRKEDLAK